MAAAPLDSSWLQNMLQSTVQSVQWTYSIFWQFCPQQEILVWGDGHYNGAIKTRKKVQTMGVSDDDDDDEGTLQRSKQLRELYESLSVVETNQHSRRTFATLSPEDLTEPEWFYLMSPSFSFAPGVGLEGKAYARRQHVWLVGANEVEGKTFSRAILAKSAHIQTVVCIPVLYGVVEFGTTDKVQEDLDFVQYIKHIFTDVHNFHHHPQPHKPAISENSTSNPAADPTVSDILNHDDIDVDDEEDECDDGRTLHAMMAELSEVMQVEMPDDIRIGSSNEPSNNFYSDFHFLATESIISDSLSTQVIPLVHVEDMTEEDTYYNTYSTFQSAFTNYNIFPNHHHLPKPPLGATSQHFLKCILFTVPYLHTKNHQQKYFPQTLDTAADSGGDPAAQSCGNGTPQHEVTTLHVRTERRRREKLNERFIILRSLVPSVTKTDKASILGDTIEYVKLLQRRIQDLEAHNPQILEKEEQQRSGVTVMVGTKKRKLRNVERKNEEALISMEVSIIESDALLELECPHREGLLLDMIQKLRELRIEVIGMKSSLNNGVLVAELRGKVKENVKGKKVCIVEVKSALTQIIPHTIQ